MGNRAKPDLYVGRTQGAALEGADFQARPSPFCPPSLACFVVLQAAVLAHSLLAELMLLPPPPVVKAEFTG